MLCTSCRRTLLTRISTLTNSQTPTLVPSRTVIRTVATVPSTKNAAPSTPPPSTKSPNTPPAAIASSTPGKSQPFSEPFFPSTTTATTQPNAPSSPKPTPSAPQKLTSSCPGGKVFTSLTYTKNAAKPVVALEDHEYPPWLWNLVPDPNAPSSTLLDGGVDVASMTKRSRAKYERKQAKLMAGMEKPVPLHEQARDLTGPGDDAVVSSGRRRELTKSMREARRKGIREANFLRSM